MFLDAACFDVSVCAFSLSICLDDISLDLSG